jgi:hypothetical protein
MIDLWPLIVTAIGCVIGWQWKESHAVKVRVAVLEQTLDDLKQSMKRTIETLQKTIENIQKRQDSHSKKQDDIMDLLTDFKMEMLREVGNMSSNVSGLASDVKNLSNLISITDVGIKVDKHKK